MSELFRHRGLTAEPIIKVSIDFVQLSHELDAARAALFAFSSAASQRPPCNWCALAWANALACFFIAFVCVVCRSAEGGGAFSALGIALAIAAVITAARKDQAP